MPKLSRSFVRTIPLSAPCSNTAKYRSCARPTERLLRRRQTEIRESTRDSISAEPPRGGYLFFGEEDYMKLTLLRMVQDAVCPADDPMATFNSLRLDGLDLTAARLLDAMAAPPSE